MGETQEVRGGRVFSFFLNKKNYYFFYFWGRVFSKVGFGNVKLLESYHLSRWKCPIGRGVVASSLVGPPPGEEIRMWSSESCWDLDADWLRWVCAIALFFLKYVFLFFLSFIFFYLFLAALGLRCCAQAFSSCRERGLLFIAVHGLLIAVASLVVEHGL